MAYIKKINGYVIKDAEAHSRLDVVEGKLEEGVGKIDKIKVNSVELAISTDGDKTVTISADGTYNESTNKIATQSTVSGAVDAAVQGLLGEGVSQAYDTFKEIQGYIETHGNEAASMAGNISKNASDIDALEATVNNIGLEQTYNSTEQALTLSVGNGGTVDSEGFRNAKWIEIKDNSDIQHKYINELHLNGKPALLLIGIYDTTLNTSAPIKTVKFFIPKTEGLNKSLGKIYFPVENGTIDVFELSFNDSNTIASLYRSANFAGTFIIMSVILVRFD